MNGYKINYDLQKPAMDFKRLVTSADYIKNAILDLEKWSNKYKRAGYEISIDDVNKALIDGDADQLREISRVYSRISGIYMRFIRYLSGLLTYLWYVYPVNENSKKVNKNKVIDKQYKILKFCDSLNLKTTLQEITNKVLSQGCYYGYLITNGLNTQADIFELPLEYCRSRFQIDGCDAVEFNIQYFDKAFPKVEDREYVLKNFPNEFKDAYKKYKKGRIPMDKRDYGYWFLCDPNLSMKFSFNNDDIPIMTSVIPSLMELDKAKDLDLRKTMQELLKIIVQKMPLTKDGDMLFDIDEAAAMHANAMNMLGGAESVDVLTTFADIDAIDLDNRASTTASDPLTKVERQVYNEAGISQMLFATDGNIALEKSILNDESLMFYLLRQYENKLNRIIYFLFKDKKFVFRIKFPEITQNNQEKKVKLYKEMANSGYSKLVPAIASGYNQSEFLALIDYENDVLDLTEKLIPAQISSTQSAKNQDKSKSATGEKKVGAPEKDPDEKAEKTIQNIESLS